MRRRSKHGSGSRWLLEQARWEVDQRASHASRIRNAVAKARASLDQRPFIWSGLVQAIAFSTAWAAGAITLFPYIAIFDVNAPSALIATAWQVLAGFAAIAFAGLAVLMQLTSEPVVTSRGVRQVLFEESQFRPVLAFSIVGAIQVGIAALFLDQPESAVVEVAIVALTILWIGWSYARVGKVYAIPGEALRLGEAAILRDLRASLREAHTLAIAETRLHVVTPRDWSWAAGTTSQQVALVSAVRAGRLIDIDIDLLRDITREITDDDASAFTASAAPSSPTEPPTADPPELRIRVSIDSSVDSGQEIYVLVNPDSYGGDLAQLRNRLTKTLRWEED